MSQIAIIQPLRNRDFRLLWIGQTTSLLGDGVFHVALAWQVYSLSSQPAAFSTVLMARSAPMLLLLLIGGVVTDRVDRRTVMLVSDIVRGLCVAVMAALAGRGALELWHLVVLGAVFGAADAFFLPASTSIIPDILSAELLLQANALESATRPLAIRFAGPAIGGLLVGRLGTAPAFWLDAATFAVSAGSLWLMAARPAPQGRRSSVFGEIVEGYRYARAEAWIWVTLVAATFAVLFAVGPFEVLMPLIAKDRLRAGAEGFGAIIAASGAGGILAAVIASHLGNPRRRITAMFLMWAAGSFAFGAIGIPLYLTFVLVFAGIAGFAFEYGSVLWSTMLGDWVPRHLLGRVRSLDFLVSFALMPVSYALVGSVSVRLGIVTTLLIGGVLSGMAWLVGWFWPHVRDRER